MSSILVSKSSRFYVAFAVSILCLQSPVYAQSENSLVSGNSFEVGETRLRDVAGVKRKKTKKKIKKINKNGKANITLKLRDGEYFYNRDIVYLKHKAKVKVCSRDNVISEPYAVGPFDGIYEYGELFPRKCRTKRFVNKDSDARSLKLFDARHSLAAAPFCMYPKKRRCTRGTFERTDTGGVQNCALEETCCGDGKDNDNDGLTDCDDDDCVGKGKCKSCATRTVPATVKYVVRTRPDGKHCLHVGLATWLADTNKKSKSVSARAYYTWTYSEGSFLRSEFETAPFDDVLPLYDEELLASEGTHQIVILRGSIDQPNDQLNCTKASAETRTHITGDQYVEEALCPVE